MTSLAIRLGGCSFSPEGALTRGPRGSPEVLSKACSGVRAFLIKENRPNPDQQLLDRAVANQGALAQAFSDCVVTPVVIFGSVGAVGGGRNVVADLHRQDFTD